VEIIVVDNGSKDDSPEYIRELIKNGIIDRAILFKENQGISKGYNSGFAVSDPRSQYLIKLDCDVIIHDNGWFEEMEQIFKEDESIGLLMLFQDNHPTMNNCKRTLHLGRTFISLEEIIVGSACFTIPRNIINEIGYFFEDHEYLLFYDDIDYFIRIEMLQKKGFYLLSHTSSYQEHLDESTYQNYDKGKDPLYAEMNEFNKVLEKNYRTGNFPIKRFYSRLDKLAKLRKSKLLEL
jgi:glycosyltransferase involved in cell wall biosynthesis